TRCTPDILIPPRSWDHDSFSATAPHEARHAPPCCWLAGRMPATIRGSEAEKMDQPSSRACPNCGSGDYAFRSRKQIDATAEQEAMLETKYKCKICGAKWKEKVPGMLRKRPPAGGAA